MNTVFVNDNNKIVIFGPHEKYNKSVENCEKIYQIACGYDHTIFFQKNEIHGIGSDDVGQLAQTMKCTSPSMYLFFFSGVYTDQLACGHYHTIMIGNKFTNHKTFVFGANGCGQLGLGHNQDQAEPEMLFCNTKIKHVACGQYHTILVKDNNDVLVFGSNKFGQLGLGHNIDQNSPQLLMDREEIRQVACGDQHSIVLKNNNDVVVFGANKFGQLGLGHTRHQNKPVLLTSGDAIYQIACGGEHTLILKNNGDVLSFGSNLCGQLGLGHYDDQNSPCLLMAKSNICQISCGVWHTVMLDTNGNIFVFGSNSRGKLGLDKSINSKNEPHLLNQKGRLLMNQQKYFSQNKWKTTNHLLFPSFFQKQIMAFLLINNLNKKQTNLNIPKFVRFMIIEYVCNYFRLSVK